MAKQTKPRLGRGLSSLIGQPVEVPTPHTPKTQTNTESSPPATPTTGERFSDVPLVSILPSPFQPRNNPNDADLETLAASIRASGVMQPVAVRPIDESDPRHRSGARFELVAGERRWRAAQLAGLDTIPALVVRLSDQESAEWALVENVQRTDLSPIERADALRRLADRFRLSHGALADRLGLNRSTVTNLIRITELEDEIKELLRETLSTGHAKALLAIPPGPRRVRIARQAAENAWSVRKIEQIAASPPSRGTTEPTPSDAHDPHLESLEKQLSDHLATRVRLRTDPTKTKGRIIIDFYGIEHFEGLMKTLGIDFES